MFGKRPSTQGIPLIGMYTGFVKDVVDKNFSGRLKVWIPEFNSREDDPTGWITCAYCSPFAGSTPLSKNKQDSWKFEDTQTTYGFWAVPPDLDNEVAIIFPNGDPARAIWIGCMYREYMNMEVPGVPSSAHTVQYPKRSVPAAEYNKVLVKEPFTQPFDPRKRAYHKTRFTGVSAQGLLNDRVRGINTSGAQRESPSMVYGILTPGPLSENGHRTGGSSFVMDDAVGSEYIAMVTKSGGQIRIDETNELVYFINKPGTAWMQMDKDGNVDVFGAKSISMRSQEDINFRADRNINIEAGQNIYLKAAKDTDSSLKVVGEGAGIGGDIYIQALNDEHHWIKNNVFLTVTDGNIDFNIKTGNKKEFVNGNVDIKAGGSYHIESGGASTITASNSVLDSSGNLKVNGTINSGGDIVSGGNVTASNGQDLAGVKNHTHKYNPGGAPPVDTVPFSSGGGSASQSPYSAQAAVDAQVKTPNSKVNILLEFSDPFTRKTEGVSTIVDRFITFEPCPEHKNSGK